MYIFYIISTHQQTHVHTYTCIYRIYAHVCNIIIISINIYRQIIYNKVTKIYNNNVIVCSTGTHTVWRSAKFRWRGFLITSSYYIVCCDYCCCYHHSSYARAITKDYHNSGPAIARTAMCIARISLKACSLLFIF